MKWFLNFVESVTFYFGCAMIPVYASAEIFVMKNAEVQEFLVAQGIDMVLMPLVACVVVGYLKNILETTQVPARDAAVFGIIGLIIVAAGSFGYFVPQSVPASGLSFGISIILSLFILALSLAFWFKAERTSQERGLNKQSGP